MIDTPRFRKRGSAASEAIDLDAKPEDSVYAGSSNVAASGSDAVRAASS